MLQKAPKVLQLHVVLIKAEHYLFDEEMFFTQACCQCLIFLAAQKILLLALDGKKENQGWGPYKMADVKKRFGAQRAVFLRKGGSITDRNHGSEERQPRVAWGKKWSWLRQAKSVAEKGVLRWRKNGHTYRLFGKNIAGDLAV